MKDQHIYILGMFLGIMGVVGFWFTGAQVHSDVQIIGSQLAALIFGCSFAAYTRS